MARTQANDHDQKRQHIMMTASDLFAKRGYERASMNELAQACGISKALIYYYYQCKDDLIYELLLSHLTKVKQAVDSKHLTFSSAQDRLTWRVKALLMSYEGADNIHRLMMEGTRSLPTDYRAELHSIQRDIVHYFADDIVRIKPDYFATNETALMPVTMSLFGMLNWFYLWHQGNGPMTRSDYATMASQILLGGLDVLAIAQNDTPVTKD